MIDDGYFFGIKYTFYFDGVFLVLITGMTRALIVEHLGSVNRWEVRKNWWFSSRGHASHDTGYGKFPDSYLVAHPTARKWVSSPQFFEGINPLLIPCKSLGWTNPLTIRGMSQQVVHDEAWKLASCQSDLCSPNLVLAQGFATGIPTICGALKNKCWWT